MARRSVPAVRYADAVIEELTQAAPAFAQRRLVSVYFGGGTPSRWAPREVGRVLDEVLGSFAHRASVPEVTLEANPADLDPGRIRALVAAGVRRFSLGVQSFADSVLAGLGRRHDSARARRALSDLRAHAADAALSVDLMLGLPGQSVAAWRRDLHELTGWAPEHVSLYALTVGHSTPLGLAVARGTERRADDEQVVDMLHQATDTLGAQGYERYEISNFARAGQRAVHNMLYWTSSATLGVGAGAHSHLPLRGGRQGLRWANTAAPDTYLAAPGVALGLCERLDAAATARERLVCGLRLVEGLDIQRHVGLGGSDPRAVRPRVVASLEAAGLVLPDVSRLRLTEAGRDVCDAIAVELAD